MYGTRAEHLTGSFPNKKAQGVATLALATAIDFRDTLSINTFPARRAGRFGLIFLDLADHGIGVNSRLAMLAAFCSAVRSTLVGTMTPIFIISP